MKNSIVVFAAGLLAGALLMITGPIASQEGGDDGHAKYGRTPPSEAEMQEGMARWQETMATGVRHERLAYFLGDWETSMVIDSGHMPPTPTKGKSTFRWLLEGRWLAQETEANMMGMPMKGFGLMGYDNYKRQYVGCWVDSLSTALLTMQGNIDRTGKVIVQYGPMDEPMMQQIGKTAKYVTRIVDENTFVFEIHDLDIIGAETEVVTVTYTRVEDEEE